jgi:predicted dehydrogenase
MNIGIIGCGLVGQKRSTQLAGANLVAIYDINTKRAQDLSKATGAKVFGSWQEIIDSKGIDIVIVATTHEWLYPITKAAILAGKHVLVEKPAARTIEEIEELQRLAKEHSVLVRVGFNHRYHPALQQARKMVDDDAIGDLMYIRAKYGHGGRIGYDREWRSDPNLAAGGELVEQGIHIIDLANWFFGFFTYIDGFASTQFWDQELDDNATMILKTIDKKFATLTVSCTEWKNIFCFEIYGKKGKIEINGLGGSYGTERLTYYKVRPEMGPPETVSWEWPFEDRSWGREMQEFLEDIKQNREPEAGLEAARKAWRIINKVYAQS